MHNPSIALSSESHLVPNFMIILPYLNLSRFLVLPNINLGHVSIIIVASVLGPPT